MRRFGLWMTIGILLSLPALVFAQGTSGCSGNKLSKVVKKTTEGKEPKTETDTGKKQ